MDTADFDFHLPHELIAQEPPAERGASRLLVLDRHTGGMEHTAFHRIAHFLERGDLLVVNNSRVFPARLLGKRLPAGGAVECLLMRRIRDPIPGLMGQGSGVAIEDVGSGVSEWEALMHPGQKLKPGARVVFGENDVQIHGEVIAMHYHGRRTIRLWTDSGISLEAAIDRIGHMPLPPYIKRPDVVADRDRYQTIYARERGSIAAPTAGLHFTARTLAELDARGVELGEVTLHVGYGTFKPIRAARIEDHVVDPERFHVPAVTAEAISRARREARRVIAVGTTTVRVLESLTVTDSGEVKESSGETNLFIRPGHKFHIVNGLVTNFHLPQSSLLVLVAAFAGRECILNAYRAAVAEGYMFFSYGDAMLIR